jgi:hypothetical protein
MVQSNWRGNKLETISQPVVANSSETNVVLRKLNGYRLFSESRAVFAFPDVTHFLANELARLRARRPGFALGLFRSLDSLFFRHEFTSLLSALLC